jgi:hypothetical protein
MRLLSTLDDSEPTDDRLALIIGELQSFFVGNPQVNATATGVHPEEMTEPKLIANSRIEDAHSDRDECPAATTYVRTRAAGTNGIVIGHINIEDELSLLRREG